MKSDVRLWLIGLALFIPLIALGVMLLAATDYGILDHQQAGSADRVETIQRAWREAGLRWLAIVAMLGDLVFITLYSAGAFVAGRSLLGAGGVVRVAGLVGMASAPAFYLADTIETGLQLYQLLADEGSDRLATIVAAMQIPKLAAWISSFLAIATALLIRRWSAPGA